MRKKVFSLEGPAREFLMRLSSNVPEAPRNAFLDAQGKIIAAFHQAQAGPDRFVIIIEGGFAERMAGHLRKYLDLESARLVPQEDMRVYHDLEGAHAASKDERLIPEKKGALLATPKDYPADVSEEEYTGFRLKYGIPVQGIDFDREMLLNLCDDSRVSFTKGCFLGQEIVARVHYRARPPKRLSVERFPAGGQVPQDLTSAWKDPVTGETLGFRFAKG